MLKITKLKQVVDWRLCTGCGACAAVCPEKQIELRDIPELGIRPYIKNGAVCSSCFACIEVCPGHEISQLQPKGENGWIEVLRTSWGPVLEIWEGYAADPEIRRLGSSGGVVTAVALFCLEKENMAGVLHTCSRPEKPWQNMTCLSTRRAELLMRTGSRYAPASPCDGFVELTTVDGPCVFIGKPCDLAGLTKSIRYHDGLKAKIGVTLGIFCAGTPSTQGTLELMRKFNINPDDVEEIRYRGDGWPGTTKFRFKQNRHPTFGISYKESWGFLQRYRPFRCYLCPDTTAEFSDISCGDPWHHKVEDNAAGYSVILVRTELGRCILKKAAEAGYIMLWPTSPSVLESSQKNLLVKRRAIWGRLLTMRALGIPAPKMQGFHLFRNWIKSSPPQQIRSILSTVKRIVVKKYWKPLHYDS